MTCWSENRNGRRQTQIDYNVAKAKRGSGTYQAHHLGTTRMSANPENGVVDANLRCHDVSNLYVTGASVFLRLDLRIPR